jgi:hypothetical protein
MIAPGELIGAAGRAGCGHFIRRVTGAIHGNGIKKYISYAAKRFPAAREMLKVFFPLKA